MPLVGLAGAFVMASVADLAGNDKTRGFTRKAFGTVVLVEMGAASAIRYTVEAGAGVL